MKLTIDRNQSNHSSAQLLTERAGQLGVEKKEIDGAILWNFGICTQDSLASGCLLAKICAAAGIQVSAGDRTSVEAFLVKELAESLGPNTPPLILDQYFSSFSSSFPTNQTFVAVSCQNPAQSLLGSQYAGWPLSCGKYFAMISGPGRQIRGKEKLLEQFNFQNEAQEAVLVLETSSSPGPAEIREIRKELGWADSTKKPLHLCFAPTSSVAGSLQIVARSIETALHQYDHHGFPLSDVGPGFGIAPLPPKTGDDFEAMGRTNDAIIYGGLVGISAKEFVNVAEFQTRVEKLSSRNSQAFGKSFAQLFKDAGGDFYKMDPALFSPGSVFCLNHPSTPIPPLDISLLDSLWNRKM